MVELGMSAISRKSLAGWWFQPIWKIWVKWDYYSQYMGKSPNHQPDWLLWIHDDPCSLKPPKWSKCIAGLRSLIAMTWTCLSRSVDIDAGSTGQQNTWHPKRSCYLNIKFTTQLASSLYLEAHRPVPTWTGEFRKDLHQLLGLTEASSTPTSRSGKPWPWHVERHVERHESFGRNNTEQVWIGRHFLFCNFWKFQSQFINRSASRWVGISSNLSWEITMYATSWLPPGHPKFTQHGNSTQQFRVRCLPL